MRSKVREVCTRESELEPKTSGVDGASSESKLGIQQARAGIPMASEAARWMVPSVGSVPGKVGQARGS